MLVCPLPSLPSLTAKQENISIVNAQFRTDRFGLSVDDNFLDATSVQVPDPALPTVLVWHGRPTEAQEGGDQHQEGHHCHLQLLSSLQAQSVSQSRCFGVCPVETLSQLSYRATESAWCTTALQYYSTTHWLTPGCTAQSSLQDCTQCQAGQSVRPNICLLLITSVLGKLNII